MIRLMKTNRAPLQKPEMDMWTTQPSTDSEANNLLHVVAKNTYKTRIKHVTSSAHELMIAKVSCSNCPKTVNYLSFQNISTLL